MKIKFIINLDLESQKYDNNLYLDPLSELSKKLSEIQNNLEIEFSYIDRTRYKSVCGKMCSFFINVIDAKQNHLKFLRNKKILENLEIDIKKLKWEFINNILILRIGILEGKEMYINVCHILQNITDKDKIRILEIKNEVLN